MFRFFFFGYRATCTIQLANNRIMNYFKYTRRGPRRTITSRFVIILGVYIMHTGTGDLGYSCALYILGVPKHKQYFNLWKCIHWIAVCSKIVYPGFYNSYWLMTM